MSAPQLLPYPRHLRVTGGSCQLPKRVSLAPDHALPMLEVRQLLKRLNAATEAVQVRLPPARTRRPPETLISFCKRARPASTPDRASDETYELHIDRNGVLITYHKWAGLRAGVATLCQLLRQYGSYLPCLSVRDWPDFPRRGVLLDVSRGRVPKLETLKQLATDLAGFKINEVQLYMEHTFAYRDHPQIWREWGALTADEIRELDAHCRALGIDLVPNQNSFGHLRHWLEHKQFKPLAEVQAPYPSADGTFLRYPSTLAPNHRGTLPFLRSLYDELLPNFSSQFFNVGCDETWDLGRGQSQALCQHKAKGRVYLDFLLKVYREVRKRGQTMMIWGDIILKYPNLIPKLPKDMIALDWGYEASHPFRQESQAFAQANIPFYVCPGTSTWQTLIGKNDTAFANLKAAARAGKRNGAIGYLITDWGDGGHPQPLAVSYPSFVVGSALAWCSRTYDEARLAPVLNRDLFHDPTGRAAQAALRMGLAHRKFAYTEPNATPFGATIAAPPSEHRELFCRNGLKYYARLSPAAIRSAQALVARERLRLNNAKPVTATGRTLAKELDLAAQMAQESCRYLLWQQALANAQARLAQALAAQGIRNLKRLKRDFGKLWPTRNKSTPAHCAEFLDWRIRDYAEQRLHYSRSQAQLP